MRHLIHFVALCALVAVANCHVVISYPGWRGNNLIRNGTVEETNGVGVGFSGDTMLFPYGMQWIYPCGGLPIAENRTNWPVTGGAVAFQPGWFTGHKNALLYVNIGFGTVPQNYSVPLAARFEIEGPTDYPYPGTICLSQLPIPEGFEVKVGDHATIQVIETALHGASMYSCVDITFTDPADVVEVDATDCFNSTTINFVSNDGDSPASQSNDDIWGTASVTKGRASLFGTPTGTTSSATSSSTPNEAAGNKLGRAFEASLLTSLFGALRIM